MLSFRDALSANNILILDGAMGTELQRRGVPMDDEVWSAKATLEHGDVVRAVHEDYIEAGADIITTNTFPAGLGILTTAGMTEEFGNLNRRAVELALEARENAAWGREVFVAGSISSWDGTPRPPIRLSMEKAKAAYWEQAAMLAAAGADLLLLEMMHSVEHARCAAEAALSTGLPTLIGLSCVTDSDRALILSDYIEGRDGVKTPLAAAQELAKLEITGLAVMHTVAHDVAPALGAIRKWWSGPIGAYAHWGDFEMPNWKFDHEFTTSEYVRLAEQWKAEGARIIGGCCGIGPEYIRVLSDMVR